LGGSLKDVEVDYLAAKVLDEIAVRAGIEKSKVDEVITGQAKQSADFPNFARIALLRAGFPIEVTRYTVHRNCGSGLQAINNGAQQIMCGLSDIVIAGGTESMSTAPYYLRNVRYGLRVGNTELLDSNTESQTGAQPID
jgi:acetyl-CoA C-acetyltransferase